MTTTAERDEEELGRRFVTRLIDVEMPGGPVRLLAPNDADDLITEADYVRDERLPYWADLWPSSIALARLVPELMPGPARVLELGCGLGLVTVAALRAGHDVLATDYYDDALIFTRRNARANAGREPSTQMADWRAWPDTIRNIDLVLAADVLYEMPYAIILADILVAVLAPEGVAIVADPGRIATDQFLKACVARNLQVSVRNRVPHHDGAISQVITMHEIRRSAA